MRARVLAAAIIAIVVAGLVYGMPAPSRTYTALSIVAAALVASGFILLVVVIPAMGVLNRDIRTEFFSARAAYYCVVAGLLLFGIVAIGAVVGRVMLTVTRR